MTYVHCAINYYVIGATASEAKVDGIFLSDIMTARQKCFFAAWQQINEKKKIWIYLFKIKII